MTQMKKQLAIFSMLLAVVLLATNAVAQKGGGGGGGGGKSGKSSDRESNKDQKIADTSNAELEGLTSKLTLTDPQKAQVKSVLDGRDAQLLALKKQKLDKDESKDKAKEIKDSANTKIRTLLTPDQQAIFDGAKKKGGKKNKGESPDSAPAATPAEAPGSPTP
jgi:Spy/CpxP family protein refolding chaperone